MYDISHREFADLAAACTRNVGNGNASSVVGTLTSATPGITILDGSADWLAIVASGVQGSQSPHFRFEIDGSVPCGTLIDFDLDVLSSC